MNTNYQDATTFFILASLDLQKEHNTHAIKINKYATCINTLIK